MLQIYITRLKRLYYSDMNSVDTHGTCKAVSVTDETVILKTYDGLYIYHDDCKFLLPMTECPIDHIGSHQMESQGLNDIVLAVGIGEFFHYNGDTWYFESWPHSERSTKYYNLDFKDDLVVMVGHLDYDTAVIVRGHR